MTDKFFNLIFALEFGQASAFGKICLFLFSIKIRLFAKT